MERSLTGKAERQHSKTDFDMEHLKKGENREDPGMHEKRDTVKVVKRRGIYMQGLEEQGQR